MRNILPKKTEVLIIGGGVIGVCAAYYLAKNGRSVTLIEKGEIGAAASHGNAGWVAVGEHSLPMATKGVLTQGLRWLFDASSPFYIKPRLDWELIRWLYQFQKATTQSQSDRSTALLVDINLKSLELFKQIFTEEKIESHFSHSGLLHLYVNEGSFQKGVKKATYLKRLGVESQILEGTAVQEKEPVVRDEIRFGIYYPSPASMLPGAFVTQLAEIAASKGATICTKCELLDFEKSGGRITAVSTTKGRIEADEVVLAAGAWSVPLAKKLGVTILMQPAKGYSITVKKTAACPSIPLALDDHKIAATPMGDYFRYSSTLELAGFDDGVNGRRLQATREGIKSYLNQMDELEELEIWRGYRPTSPDSLPLIGRSQKIKNLIVATGHGMLGITHGPFSGDLVCQLIMKQADEALWPSLDFERF